LLQPDDDAGVAGRTADGQWIAIENTGWTAFRPEWMTLSRELNSLPAIDPKLFVPAMQPPGTSSGYPAVDIVIDAVLTQDLPRLRVQAETQSLQCQAQPGLGGAPPCSLKPGTAPNTNLDVFPTSTCEGEHILAENLAATLTKLYTSGAGGPGAQVTNVPLRLYAVVEGPKDQSPFFPDGRWVAIFAQPDGTGRAVGITERGIVRIDFGCNAQATEMLQRRQFEAPLMTLPPVLAPPVHPRP
jgi:hypothetical protein